MNSTKEEKRARWVKMLLLDGQNNLEASVLGELADYQAVSLEEARNNCLLAKSKLAEEWNESGYKNPSKYYINTRWYIYDQAMYHIQTGPYEAGVDFLEFCSHKGLKRVLDFGGGIGSFGILLAKQGFEVTIGDVSEQLLDFARRRFRKRCLKADFINLLKMDLPGGYFDAVIATDVLEHLRDFSKEINRIYGTLKEGGYFLFNVVETSDAQQPMHITTASMVIRDMRRLGFKKVKYASSSVYTYQKAVRKALVNNVLGFLDRLYYSLRQGGKYHEKKA